MNKTSIFLVVALLALASCTKSKIVHPEIGNGNDEIITVGVDNVQIKYIRNDVASLQKVMFNYSLADEQQFASAEMTKHSDCFTLTLNNLLSDTLYSYYYELYPYNSNAYQTDQKTFRTQVSAPTPPPVVVPTGAISGLFTINANGDQIYFSRGNLQYIGSAAIPYWKFAEHQWDYLWTTTGQNSDDQNVDRDLFGWGTSGMNNGNLFYQPYDVLYTINAVDYGFGYGPTDGINFMIDLTGTFAYSDWGVFNSILNGGNQPNLWRTLSENEWRYIINNRTTPSDIRFAKCILNGVNGVVLLPDNWNSTIFTLNSTNIADAFYYTNEITLTDWETMENNGAVFLPAAGNRNGTSIGDYGNKYGSYWSVSYGGSGSAYAMEFGETHLIVNDIARYNGISVRLVQNYNNK